MTARCQILCGEFPRPRRRPASITITRTLSATACGRVTS